VIIGRPAAAPLAIVARVWGEPSRARYRWLLIVTIAAGLVSLHYLIHAHTGTHPGTYPGPAPGSVVPALIAGATAGTTAVDLPSHVAAHFCLAVLNTLTTLGPDHTGRCADGCGGLPATCSGTAAARGC
jgi:hypothetical protein